MTITPVLPTLKHRLDQLVRIRKCIRENSIKVTHVIGDKVPPQKGIFTSALVNWKSVLNYIGEDDRMISESSVPKSYTSKFISNGTYGYVYKLDFTTTGTTKESLKTALKLQPYVDVNCRGLSNIPIYRCFQTDAPVATATTTATAPATTHEKIEKTNEDEIMMIEHETHQSRDENTGDEKDSDNHLSLNVGDSLYYLCLVQDNIYPGFGEIEENYLEESCLCEAMVARLCHTLVQTNICPFFPLIYEEHRDHGIMSTYMECFDCTLNSFYTNIKNAGELVSIMMSCFSAILSMSCLDIIHNDMYTNNIMIQFSPETCNFTFNFGVNSYTWNNYGIHVRIIDFGLSSNPSFTKTNHAYVQKDKFSESDMLEGPKTVKDFKKSIHCLRWKNLPCYTRDIYAILSTWKMNLKNTKLSEQDLQLCSESMDQYIHFLLYMIQQCPNFERYHLSEYIKTITLDMDGFLKMYVNPSSSIHATTKSHIKFGFVTSELKYPHTEKQCYENPTMYRKLMYWNKSYLPKFIQHCFKQLQLDLSHKV